MRELEILSVYHKLSLFKPDECAMLHPANDFHLQSEVFSFHPRCLVHKSSSHPRFRASPRQLFIQLTSNPISSVEHFRIAAKPILLREDGTQLRLEEGGLILGTFPESGYRQGEVELRPGDRLVLFTDGVTEAMNGKQEEFGEERLVQALLSDRQLTSESLQHRLLDRVNDFSGGEPEDDVTVLVVSVPRGESAKAKLANADVFERGHN